MKKVFFTDGRGVTATSATAVANYAQERKSAYMSVLQKVNFVTEYRDVVGTASSEKKVRSGYTAEQLGGLVALAEKCAKLDSLCAWLREAVKAKAEWLEQIDRKCRDEYVAMPEEPEAPVQLGIKGYCVKYELAVPEEPEQKSVQVEDILQEMDIKSYCKYLAANSSAAVFGKLAHADGQLNAARKELHDRIASPYDVEESMIRHYEPTVQATEVDDVFAVFQATQRSYNAEYNGMKQKVLEEVDARNRQLAEEYRQAYCDYTQRRKELQALAMQEYNEALAAYNEQYEQYSLERKQCLLKADEMARQEREQVSALKIAIPDQLQALYTELSDELRK